VLVQTDKNSLSGVTLKIAGYFKMLPLTENEQKRKEATEKQTVQSLMFPRDIRHIHSQGQQDVDNAVTSF